MAERRPLVMVSGVPQELPTGDTVAGATGSSSGTFGLHAPLAMPAGSFVIAGLVVAGSATTTAMAAGRAYACLFLPATTITVDQFSVDVTTVAAGSSQKIGIYANDASAMAPTGAPLASSGDLSGAAIATVTWTPATPFTFTAGTAYWIAVHASSTQTLRSLTATNLHPLGLTSGTSTVAVAVRSQVSTYSSGMPTGASSTWPLLSSNMPMVRMRTA